MTDFQTMTCKASVWPHHHRNEGYGPLDLRISYRNRPPAIQFWAMKLPLYTQLEQPDERTNLTLVHLAFGCHAERRYTRYRIRKDKSISVYLKARVINPLPHPVPTGRWDGTCEYGDDWCIFTFQAVSLRVKPEESRIIIS